MSRLSRINVKEVSVVEQPFNNCPFFWVRDEKVRRIEKGAPRKEDTLSLTEKVEVLEKALKILKVEDPELYSLILNEKIPDEDMELDLENQRLIYKFVHLPK